MKYIFITLFLILPFSLSAQTGRDTYTLLEPLPCVQSTGNDIACDTDSNTIKTINTQTYILYLYRFSFSFAAALAVVMIILGGFQYALSDSIFTKSEASSRIKNAVVGLLMFLGSYLILETIDPRLVEVKSTLDPVEVDIQKIDYGKFLGEVDYASQLKELDDASRNSKALKKQASDLRAQADAEPDEEKSIKLRTDALELERQAERITSQTTNKVLYESFSINFSKGSERLGDLVVGKGTTPELTLKLSNLESSYDKDIKRLSDSGDLIGATELTKQKEYYKEALKLDHFTYAYINDIRASDSYASDEKLGIAINKLTTTHRSNLIGTSAFSAEEVDKLIDARVKLVSEEAERAKKD